MVLSAIQTPQPRPECRQRNVMDERINTPVEPNPKTARAKRQEVSSSFDDVTMKDAAPNPTLSVDNVSVMDQSSSTCSSSSVSSANSILIGEGTEHLAGKHSPCIVISTYDG